MESKKKSKKATKRIARAAHQVCDVGMPMVMSSSTDTTHKIDDKAILSGMYKANIPARFIRKEVTLMVFPWGDNLRGWINTEVPEARRDGKCLFVSSPSKDSFTVSAMIARTLVLHGKDAIFTSLAKLLEGEVIRQSEYLVVAGFYDDGFNKSHGIPMSTEAAHRLAWGLWHLYNEGTTIIAQCSPNWSGMSNWWHLGVLESLFDKSNSITIKA